MQWFEQPSPPASPIPITGEARLEELLRQTDRAELAYLALAERLGDREESIGRVPIEEDGDDWVEHTVQDVRALIGDNALPGRTTSFRCRAYGPKGVHRLWSLTLSVTSDAQPSPGGSDGEGGGPLSKLAASVGMLGQSYQQLVDLVLRVLERVTAMQADQVAQAHRGLDAAHARQLELVETILSDRLAISDHLQSQRDTEVAAQLASEFIATVERLGFAYVGVGKQDELLAALTANPKMRELLANPKMRELLANPEFVGALADQLAAIVGPTPQQETP